MKKIVLPAVMYIILYLLSLLLFTASVFIYRMVVDYSPVFLPLRIFIAELPGTLIQVIPTATAAALVLVLLIRVRSRGRNLAGSVLITLIATALYAFPFLFLSGLHSNGGSGFNFPFFEKKLTQIENTILYVGEAGAYKDTAAPTGGGSLPIGELVLLHMNGSFPKMDFHPRASADPAKGTLQAGEPAAVIMDYASRRSLSGEFVAPPAFLEDMFQQVGELSGALKESLARGLFPFFLNTLAQVLFLVGSWSLIRTSRWPLWNGVLALVFFRGLFYLDSLFRSKVVLEGMELLTIDEYFRYAAPASFILLCMLFLMWGFFFTKSEADLEAGP